MRVASVRFRSVRYWRGPAEPTRSDALELAATLYLPGETRSKDRDDVRPPGLIVGHGAGSNRARHDEFCGAACAHGFAVLALDFRGHGESSGTVDGPLELDILAAASFLRTHPAVDGSRLCYRGSSMGGFYGLKAAAHTGFAALALLCPASERVLLDALEEAQDSVGDTEAPASPLPGGAAAPASASSADPGGGTSLPDSARWDAPSLRAYFARQDSLALADIVRCPVLLVHARGDSVVPFDHSLALAARLAGNTTLLALAGGTHTSAQHDPGVHRLTALWLLEQVKSACTGRT